MIWPAIREPRCYGKRRNPLKKVVKAVRAPIKSVLKVATTAVGLGGVYDTVLGVSSGLKGKKRAATPGANVEGVDVISLPKCSFWCRVKKLFGGGAGCNCS